MVSPEQSHNSTSRAEFSKIKRVASQTTWRASSGRNILGWKLWSLSCILTVAPNFPLCCRTTVGQPGVAETKQAFLCAGAHPWNVSLKFDNAQCVCRKVLSARLLGEVGEKVDERRFAHLHRRAARRVTPAQSLTICCTAECTC